MNKENNFKVFDVNILFLVLGVLFITVGGYIQSKNLDLGIIVTEYGILLLPVIIFAKYKNIDLKKSLRLNSISFKTILKLIFLGIFLVPIIGFGNLIITAILARFDLIVQLDMPVAQNTYELIKYIFLIAISAGICEEIFFRGMILNAYENETNKSFAIVISAILFGIFHFNIQNLLGPILIGLIFGYLVFATNSVFSAIIGHIMNNFIAVVLSFLTKNYSMNSTPKVQMNQQFFISIIFLSVFAFISFFIITLLIKSIKKENIHLQENEIINFKKERYLIVKKISKGAVLLKDSLDTKIMSIKEIYDSLKLVKYKKLRKILTFEKIEMNYYKLTPIFLTIILYVYLMISFWKSYGVL
ncbi:MAG: CPBP family glutamic-type intramembrane protease [Bacillota bacterium]